MTKFFSAEQVVIVSVSGKRETKSWVVLLLVKVAVSTLSLILSFIFIVSACLRDVSASGSGEVPSVVPLPVPKAALLRTIANARTKKRRLIVACLSFSLKGFQILDR